MQFLSKQFIALTQFLCAGLLSGLLIACSHSAPVTESVDKIVELSHAIGSLSSEIPPADADQTSRVLINTAVTLANEYDMASPALYHNMLVNMGFRERGLCCHWAEDLHAKLRELDVASLKFDWLVARQGNQLREHNTVVIYPVKATWQQGIVFDPWRKAGIPYWTAVEGDKYPWEPHPLNGQWKILRCK